MNRLMQTVSVLSFAAALSAAPVVAIAQQTTTPPTQQTEPAPAAPAESATGAAAEQAGQAADTAKEAAGEAEKAASDTATGAGAGEATDQAAGAAEEAGQAAGEAAEEAGQAAEQATDQATGTVSDTAGDAADQAAEGAEQAAEGAEEAAEGAQEAAEGAAGTAAGTAGGMTGGDVVETEAPPEPVEGTITLQDADSILASDLIGATVYNAQGDDVGEIGDAIVGLDGTIEGVVIAVGGFLGIGEKSVAVEMQQMSVQQDEDGEPQLVIDATRESLEAAPGFTTAAEQASEAASTTTAPVGDTPPMQPGAVGGAPAEGTGSATQ